MRENKNESLVLHQSGEIVQEHRITLSQLAAETGCEVTLIEEMVRFGIIEPVAQTPETLIFPDWTAGRIGKAVRLRQISRNSHGSLHPDATVEAMLR